MTSVGLSNLKLRTAYRKGEHDIARDFYLPCMSLATKYDRAVGFFSSSVYILAWKALADFVDRGGKIRIICSPVLSASDIQAMRDGYDARVVGNAIVQELRTLLADTQTEQPAKVLSALIAANVVDVRIAVVADSADYHRIFHDKLGVFHDEHGNTIVFKGSMNETWLGLAEDGNIESIDVFAQWHGGRDAERVMDECSYFDRLWNNQSTACQVRPFPDIAQNELREVVRGFQWRESLDNLLVPANKSPKTEGRIAELRPHQVDALESWQRKGRRGVFEHATGSGKTITALQAISDAITKREVPLILVPSELLLQQWADEIKLRLSRHNPKILLAGGGNDKWKSNGLLAVWSRPNNDARVIVATLHTACSDLFRAQLNQGEHLFVVADEVHRTGSPEFQKLFQIASGPRMGLSATPKRAGDPTGTAAIFQYFGDLIPPPYTIQDAIRAKILTPYYYNVHIAYLTDAEQQKWDDETLAISKLAAQVKGGSDESLAQRVQLMLINRARICKAASAKIGLAAEILKDHYSAGDRWIVYCDSEVQLRQVAARLQAEGLDSISYFASMSADRDATLDYYVQRGGIILSIRCLDEGVNIPSVDHALILASSTNPREFIQRRGRVLRRFPGKLLAHLHDVMVLPAAKPTGEPVGLRIVESELARAIEFGKYAENPTCVSDLKIIAVRYGIDVEEMLTAGVEDE